MAASCSIPASAVPAFNRQTGQNCVACHAGGQFPDLTPYGRLFKLTGYTIGQRAVPLAAMAVASYNKTSSTTSPDPNFDARAGVPKDGNLIFPTASVFLAGKVTDNIGGFVQVTYA
ncbi:MAG: cytochrome C, partial [Usitatibacter sp.]